MIGILAASVCIQVPALSQSPQIDKMSPSHIVNIGDIVQQQLGGYNPPYNPPYSSLMLVQDLTQANGNWAVLYSSSAGNSVVVGDQAGAAHAFLTGADVHQLAADREGHIHLLHSYKRGDYGREVSVVDLRGNPVKKYSVPATGERPFLRNSKVLWKSPKALAAAQAFVPLLQQSKANLPRDVLKIVGTLDDGGYFTFGENSEMITLHRPDGTVRSSFAAPLDAAYKAIDASVPKFPAGSDYSRVAWAVTTQTGLLYVCLSGLRLSGQPAYIAVIDAQTGTLQRIVAASLPTFADAVSKLNPAGTMLPGMGAIDDYLVIVNQARGVAAIY